MLRLFIYNIRHGEVCTKRVEFVGTLIESGKCRDGLRQRPGSTHRTLLDHLDKGKSRANLSYRKSVGFSPRAVRAQLPDYPHLSSSFDILRSR